jgi:hypothetical protein
MFDDLQIAIPSRSRPHVQKTIQNISQNFWTKIILVVPFDQYEEYRAAVPLDINIVPFGGQGIGAKREFILNMKKTGKLIMFDDDLTFYKRLEDGSKFARMSHLDSEQMITDIVAFLDKYVMVGMVDKFMSQTKPRGFVECTRCNKVLAFNRDMFPDPWPSFRVPHDEDHDIHLQLITRGYRTAVLTEYSKSDPVEAPGGCTDWRSEAVFDLTYKMLLEFWPTIVTIYPNHKVRYNWAEAKRMGGIT